MSFIDRILPAPKEGGFALEDYWVWCGSVIRGEDGRYHMFASRWRQEYPFFAGYIIASEIVRADAERPEGPYSFREVVLPPRGAHFWDGRMTHNPTIHRCGDTFLLYYIGSTYDGPPPKPEDTLQPSFGAWKSNTYAQIRIGLATAPSVLGPWTRRDEPILLPRPSQWDSQVVTNPAPCVQDDGSVLLLYRSNTPEGLRIGAAGANHFAGLYPRLRHEPVLQFKRGNHVEDPYVWRTEGQYELIAKDMTGGLSGEKHAGVHATSRDGLHWQLSEPAKAYSRRVQWDDGTETVQGSLERPQLLIENGQPTHLFLATGDGPGGFDQAARTWNMVLPLGT